MEKVKFEVILSKEAEAFLNTLKEKVQRKITSTFRRALM